MYKFEITNQYGQTLDLSPAPGNPYVLKDASGLGIPATTINMTALSLQDGQLYDSAKVAYRNLTLIVQIRQDAEKNRLWAYKVLRPHAKLTVHYVSDRLDVCIDGYTANIQPASFKLGQTLSINITCPNPYWYDTQEHHISLAYTKPLFHFEHPSDSLETVMGEIIKQRQVDVVNAGDVDTGITIVIHAATEAVNPIVYNMKDNTFIKLNATIPAGATVTISTLAGHKTAIQELAGVTTNLFPAVDPASTWIQLQGLGNVFMYSADSGADDLEVSVSYRNLYAGV